MTLEYCRRALGRDVRQQPIGIVQLPRSLGSFFHFRSVDLAQLSAVLVPVNAANFVPFGTL